MAAAIRALMRVAALGAGLVSAGCASYGTEVMPPGGAIYSHIRAPLTTDFHANPVGAVTKKASSSATKFLHIPLGGLPLSFSWDSAAIQKIAADGGISTVSYADYEFLNVLGIWSEFTVHVYGN